MRDGRGEGMMDGRVRGNSLILVLILLLTLVLILLLILVLIHCV